jgi:hypothetical protein
MPYRRGSACGGQPVTRLALGAGSGSRGGGDTAAEETGVVMERRDESWGNHANRPMRGAYGREKRCLVGVGESG